MIALFIYAALACPAVQMQNVTEFPWNDYDRSILDQFKVRCGQIYEDSPCVILFRKYGKQDYSIICGGKK